MKTFLIPCAALTWLAGALPAQAASTAELTVGGLITPMACTPVLSGGGLIDFGKISQQDLNQATGTRLPLKSLTLTVSC
ncbi:DUF1120 domain-containing protein, partial [Pseudomonas viridiflava]|uniref:DUF1120 domain-containing protein n=1 Tax=Pseudomonas viridiflava TaxID=33069 RepID=UPI000F03DB28